MKTVLLAEDNDDDIFVMRKACEASGVLHLLKVVNDGAAAMDYLTGLGAYADRVVYPVPSLIFLDIKMPKRNGLEVLEWIGTQAHLKRVPVIMLTGSNLMTDINRAYELGATSYLQKISVPEELEQAVRVILHYWLELNIPY